MTKDTEALRADGAFCDAVWQALKGDHSDLRKQQIILKAHRAALATPASDVAPVAWFGPIPHSGRQKPEWLPDEAIVMIAFNPRDCQTAMTWGFAAKRKAPAKDRDWENATAFCVEIPLAQSVDPVADEEALRDALVSAACDGIADDYMTSEKHHPGYVLIPSAKFEAILAALKGPASRMTDQPKQDAIVSQRARDAAADLIDQYWSGSDDGMRKLATSIRAGHRHGAFVRAFARFEAEIERCAGMTEVAEEFAKSLEKSDFANIGSALNSRMCCNGSMCGCQGATVGQYLAFELRAVIKRCAGVVPTDVVALVCAARQIMDKGYVSTAIADERPDAEALDAALEPFASRVCYDDDGGDLPEAHADPCTCGAIRNLKGQTS